MRTHAWRLAHRPTRPPAFAPKTDEGGHQGSYPRPIPGPSTSPPCRSRSAICTMPSSNFLTHTPTYAHPCTLHEHEPLRASTMQLPHVTCSPSLRGSCSDGTGQACALGAAPGLPSCTAPPHTAAREHCCRSGQRGAALARSKPNPDQQCRWSGQHGAALLRRWLRAPRGVLPLKCASAWQPRPARLGSLATRGTAAQDSAAAQRRRRGP